MCVVTFKESPVEVEILNYSHRENSSSLKKFRKISSFQLHYALTSVFAIFLSLSIFSKWPAMLNETVSPDLCGLLDSMPARTRPHTHTHIHTYFFNSRLFRNRVHKSVFETFSKKRLQLYASKHLAKLQKNPVNYPDVKFTLGWTWVFRSTHAVGFLFQLSVHKLEKQLSNGVD